MTIEKYNDDLLQPLKWMHNEAPNITKLLEKKRQWYEQFHKKFWEDWERDVLCVDTANEFGLMIWAAILAIPPEIIDLDPHTHQFGFGPKRENFKGDQAVIDAELGGTAGAHKANPTGGNFIGSNGTIKTKDELRLTIKLRYCALICNGSLAWINKMLRYIFNGGKPWTLNSENYAYVYGVNPLVPAPGTKMTNPKLYLRDWQVPSFPKPNFVQTANNIALYNQAPFREILAPDRATTQNNNVALSHNFSNLNIGIPFGANDGATGTLTTAPDVEFVTIHNNMVQSTLKSPMGINNAYNWTLTAGRGLEDIPQRHSVFTQSRQSGATSYAFGVWIQPQNIRKFKVQAEVGNYNDKVLRSLEIDFLSKTVTETNGKNAVLPTKREYRLDTYPDGWYRVVIRVQLDTKTPDYIKTGGANDYIIRVIPLNQNDEEVFRVISDAEGLQYQFSVWGFSLQSAWQDVSQGYDYNEVNAWDWTNFPSNQAKIHIDTTAMTVTFPNKSYPGKTEILVQAQFGIFNVQDIWNAGEINRLNHNDRTVYLPPIKLPASPGPITDYREMRYHFGPGIMGVNEQGKQISPSAEFIRLLNDRSLALIPQIAGIKYTVIKD